MSSVTADVTTGPRPGHEPRPWPLERVLFLMAGTMTGLSALLGALVSPWFLLLTGSSPQPAGLRRLRQLPQLVAASPLRRAARAGSDERRRPDRPARALRRHAPCLGVRRLGHLALGFGILAPRVEHALSGAGWQANGSESVQARDAIDRSLGGNGGYAIQVSVHSEDLPPATQPSGGRSAAPAAYSPRTTPSARSGSAAPRATDLGRRPHRPDPGRRRKGPQRDGRAPPPASRPSSPPKAAPGVDVGPDRRARDVVRLQRGEQGRC